MIRGATDNYMDDIERAVDDGVNTFKGLTKVKIGLDLVFEFCFKLSKFMNFKLKNVDELITSWKPD